MNSWRVIAAVGGMMIVSFVVGYFAGEHVIQRRCPVCTAIAPKYSVSGFADGKNNGTFTATGPDETSTSITLQGDLLEDCPEPRSSGNQSPNVVGNSGKVDIEYDKSTDPQTEKK